MKETFDDLTIKLLACKYAYYECYNPFITDYEYDMDEKKWYAVGVELGLLKEDETSPCTDWNPDHPLADKAIELAKKLMPKR